MAKDQASSAPAAPRGGQRRPGPQPAQPMPRAAKKKRPTPAQFLREVRAEGRKITWTSRKETWITSVMVFIMVALAVAFFWIVDTLLGYGVQALISIG